MYYKIKANKQKLINKDRERSVKLNKINIKRMKWNTENKNIFEGGDQIFKHGNLQIKLLFFFFVYLKF